MDINDLFDGIAEAFRQHQMEMIESMQTATNSALAGLEPVRESEKSEKLMPTGPGSDVL